MITPIGVIVVLLSAWFFKNSAHLLYLLAFFSPFSAATVVMFSDSKFGLQPSLLIGLVFLVRISLKVVFGRVSITRSQTTYVLILATFWMMALVSVFYPVLLNAIGIVPLATNPTLPAETEILGIQPHSVNAMLYYTCYCLIAVAMMIEIDTLKKMITVVKVLCVSALLTAAWTVLVQFPASLLDFEYPHWLFNNHPGYAQAYATQILEAGSKIPRLSSVAPEPSMYANFLISVTAILLILTLNREYVFAKTFQFFGLATLVAISWLTTSTSAYLGSGFLFIGALVAFSRPKQLLGLKIDRRQVWLGGFALTLLALGVGGFFVFMRVFQLDAVELVQIVAEFTVYKLATGGGGLVRLEYFLEGIDILLKTYLLGSGWWTNRTADLISTLLADVGVIGFAWYLFMHYVFVRGAFRASRKMIKEEPRFGGMCYALGFALLIALAMMMFTLPDFVFMYYWVIFSLVIAIPKVKQRLMQECQAE